VIEAIEKLTLAHTRLASNHFSSLDEPLELPWAYLPVGGASEIRRTLLAHLCRGGLAAQDTELVDQFADFADARLFLLLLATFSFQFGVESERFALYLGLQATHTHRVLRVRQLKYAFRQLAAHLLKYFPLSLLLLLPYRSDFSHRLLIFTMELPEVASPVDEDKSVAVVECAHIKFPFGANLPLDAPLRRLG